MTEWISVKDGLPEEGELVLTFHLAGQWSDYRLDYIVHLESDAENIWACCLDDEMHNVSHWMSLPEAPK